jgi:regulator of protease activity HflC (stomatin/prohibitin superfamily)
MQESEMKRKIKQAGKPVVFIGAAVAAIIFLLILNPFVKIDAGERGVLLNFGAVAPDVLDEGLHLRIPIIS